MRAGSRCGATAACGGGRGGCRSGCDGLALVVDGRAGVVAAGHAGGGLVGVARVGAGLATVRRICSRGGTVFVAEEAKSGFLFFGVRHLAKGLRR